MSGILADKASTAAALLQERERSANLGFQYDHGPQPQKEHVLEIIDLIRHPHFLHRTCKVKHVIEIVHLLYLTKISTRTLFCYQQQKIYRRHGHQKGAYIRQTLAVCITTLSSLQISLRGQNVVLGASNRSIGCSRCGFVRQQHQLHEPFL